MTKTINTMALKYSCSRPSIYSSVNKTHTYLNRFADPLSFSFVCSSCRLTAACRGSGVHWCNLSVIKFVIEAAETLIEQDLTPSQSRAFRTWMTSMTHRRILDTISEQKSYLKGSVPARINYTQVRRNNDDDSAHTKDSLSERSSTM